MRWAALAVLSLLIAGCVGPVASPSLSLAQQKTHEPYVVVGLIDTGINPWHDAFRLEPASQRPALPVPWETVPSVFQEFLAAEGLGAWNTLEREKLYWFEGTRVLAISIHDDIPEEHSALELVFTPDPHPIFDDVGHGTGTASVVARTSPHSWILMVETTSLNFPAYYWTARQPWIDIVTSSFGSVGHLPDNITSGRDATAQALRDAVDMGKLVLNSGGNLPDPNLLYYSGAPWVISVGGAEGDDRGVSPFTSQPVDVVANFSWAELAHSRSDNRTYSSKGTSFGSPAVAGVLAEALYRLRGQHGHQGGIVGGALVATPTQTLTNRDFRWALNMTAAYWSPSEHEPTVNLSQNPGGILYEVTNPALPSIPGTPVGPWLQMGWGFVDEQNIEAIVALLEGRAAPPDTRDAAAYMEQLFAARSALWDLRQG